MGWENSRRPAGKLTGITHSRDGFEWQPGDGYARTYGVANVLNQATSQAGVGIGWDANGNMTSDGVNTYGWTVGNRLAGVTRPGMSAAYVYDSEDRRTAKTVDGVMTRTLWSGTEPIGQYDTNGALLRLIIPDGSGAMDGRVAVVETGGDLRWQHTDHQGSVIVLTDGAGTVRQINRYGPHGETSALGGSTGVGGIFGYTGREFDPESGLYQYRARYYSPLLGLFLSTDPIGTKDDPNLYLYTGGDPVNATDPTGRSCEMVGSGRTSRLSCKLDDRGDLTRDQVRRAERNYTSAVNKLMSHGSRRVTIFGQGRSVSAREVANKLIGMRVTGDGRMHGDFGSAPGANSDGGDPGGQKRGRSIIITGLGLSRSDRFVQRTFVHEGIHQTNGERRIVDGSHTGAYNNAADNLLAEPNWIQRFTDGL